MKGGGPTAGNGNQAPEGIKIETRPFSCTWCGNLVISNLEGCERPGPSNVVALTVCYIEVVPGGSFFTSR